MTDVWEGENILKCDECGVAFDKLIEFDIDVGYSVCKDCLKKALEMLE